MTNRLASPRFRWQHAETGAVFGVSNTEETALRLARFISERGIKRRQQPTVVVDVVSGEEIARFDVPQPAAER